MKKNSNNMSYAQSRLFLHTCHSASSALPGVGSWQYSHRAVSGMEMKMLSMRDCGVNNPNL
jgi:hypothetical protein